MPVAMTMPKYAGDRPDNSASMRTAGGSRRAGVSRSSRVVLMVRRWASAKGNYRMTIDGTWINRIIAQPLNFLSAVPLWIAMWSVLSLLISYCGASSLA